MNFNLHFLSSFLFSFFGKSKKLNNDSELIDLLKRATKSQIPVQNKSRRIIVAVNFNYTKTIILHKGFDQFGTL